MCPSLLGSMLLENEGLLSSAKLDVRLPGALPQMLPAGVAAEERVAEKVIWGRVLLPSKSGRVVCVNSSGPQHGKQAEVTDAEA